MHCGCPCVCPATCVALRLCVRSGERLTLMINPQWQPQGQVISGGRAGGARRRRQNTAAVCKRSPCCTGVCRPSARRCAARAGCSTALAPASPLQTLGLARPVRQRSASSRRLTRSTTSGGAKLDGALTATSWQFWGCIGSVPGVGSRPACWPNLSDWLEAAGAQCCMPAPPCAGACACLVTTSASCAAIPAAGRWEVPALRLL